MNSEVRTVNEIKIANQDTLLDVKSTAEAAKSGVDELNGNVTAARAAKLDNLDAVVSSRATQSSVDALSANLTAARAAKLDNLDAAVISRASQSSVDNLSAAMAGKASQASADSISAGVADVKSDVGGVDAKIGASDDAASSSGTTLFALLKYIVARFAPTGRTQGRRSSINWTQTSAPAPRRLRLTQCKPT
jgi:hypothetical protein